MVLSILCGDLGGFIFSVWRSGEFYLFCVGIWVVLSILCGARVVLPILCGDLGGFIYSVWGLGSFIYSVWCLGGFPYSVWGSGWFYLFYVGPG